MDKNRYGVAYLSVIPMRNEPSDKSEMVNQILFGETFIVIDNQKQWLKIQLTEDDYQGWVDKKQVKLIAKLYYQQINANNHVCALSITQATFGHAEEYQIVLGSRLPNFDGVRLKFAEVQYLYQGDTLNTKYKAAPHQVENYAMLYKNTPYLWGGRSPFGIDCSGFTQMLFRLLGYALPRDAYQQAEVGELIDNLTDKQIGDLAFFGDDEHKITHVGVIVGNNQIIHASGQVRVDLLKPEGIYKKSTKQITHKLRAVKRILPTNYVHTENLFPRKPSVGS